MLFFSHLFLGILTGIILALFFKDRRVIVFSAIGSILPDLIDKPIGYIILWDSIGSGRIFFHGFWIMLLLLAVGVVIFLMIKNPLILSLGIGVLIHQFADSMWESPVNWFWPVFGSYSGRPHYEDYFMDIISVELSSVEEIFSFFFIIILIIVIWFLTKYGYFDGSSIFLSRERYQK
jgi:hypothetical protein